MMCAATITDFRANIAAMQDHVINNHVPLFVTRNGGRCWVRSRTLAGVSRGQGTPRNAAVMMNSPDAHLTLS